MSTIEQLPYDINRISIEHNATAKKKKVDPIYHTDVIKPVKAHAENNERRSGDERRKNKQRVIKNKRNLMIRRSIAKPLKKSQKKLAKAHKSGHIIDLEV